MSSYRVEFNLTFITKTKMNSSHSIHCSHCTKLIEIGEPFLEIIQGIYGTTSCRRCAKIRLTNYKRKLEKMERYFVEIEKRKTKYELIQ